MMSWILSALFLVGAFVLTLRTHSRQPDHRLALLAPLFGLLGSIEILAVLPAPRLLLLVLWIALEIMAAIFFIVLIRRFAKVGSKIVGGIAACCLFLTLAEVDISGRRLVQSSSADSFAVAASLLAFLVVVVLDQKLKDRTNVLTELIRCRESFERLVNSSRDGIFATDCTGQITLWNPAMELATGIAGAAAIGMQSNQVLGSIFPDQRDNPIAETLSGPEIVRVWRAPSSPGRNHERVFRGYFSPMRGPSGEVLEILAVVSEIREHSHKRTDV
jgi:PAS domain S-box-containing protein